jgi:glucosamine-6-phosphate deaminase
MIDLTQNTIEANSRLFDRIEDVPKKAVTMGIRQIMMAKRIVLIAGADKADIVEKALNGPVTPRVPASALQLHRDVTVFLALE